MFTFWNYYVLKLLRLETITLSDATLSDINIVLFYVLSQYGQRYCMSYLNLNFGNVQSTYKIFPVQCYRPYPKNYSSLDTIPLKKLITKIVLRRSPKVTGMTGALCGW